MANYFRLFVIALCCIQLSVSEISIRQDELVREYSIKNSHVRVSSNFADPRLQSQQFYRTTPVTSLANHPPPKPTEPSLPTCESRSYGRYPIPNDCSKYLRCWNGQSEIVTCRHGRKFNAISKFCEHPSNVRCPNEIQHTTQFNQETGPTSSRLIDIQSPTNNNLEKQVEELEVHEYGNIECQRSSGLQPHPTDCNKFLNCVHGNGAVQECGPGTVFNDGLQVCDWPYNVDCSRNSGNTFGEFSLDVRISDNDDEFKVRPTLSAAQLNAIKNYALEVKPLREKSPGRIQNWGTTNKSQEDLNVAQSLNNFVNLSSTDNKDHDRKTIDIDVTNFEQEIQSISKHTLNNSQKPVSGHYVHQTIQTNPVDNQFASSQRYYNQRHQTIQTNPFDNQLASSQRYISQRHKLTTQVPLTFIPTTASSVPAISKFDKEYQIDLEQRIRNRNSAQAVTTISPSPQPTHNIRSNQNESPSEQWGYHTVTQYQQQPYTSAQRQLNDQNTIRDNNQKYDKEHLFQREDNVQHSYAASGQINQGNQTHKITDPKQTILTEDIVQRTYSAVRQANSFASQPHHTIATTNAFQKDTASSNNLNSKAEKSNHRTSEPHLHKQPTPMTTYVMPSEWNIEHSKSTTTYSNAPPPTQFDSVDAAELEASLRILDSYTAQATPTRNEHITPIYNRANMARYIKQNHSNKITSSTESSKVELPTELNAEHLSAALQLLMRPYLKGLSLTTTDNSLTGMESTTLKSPLPSNRLNSSQNDLEQIDHKLNLSEKSKENTDKLYQPTDRFECQFDCKDHGRCVDHSKVCNGINDCGNYLDEQHCPNVNFQIRLSGNRAHKGLLEIHVNSKWGQVCDSQFSLTEANVACRELGFSQGAVRLLPSNHTDTWLENYYYQMESVKCLGHETSLSQCNHLGWGVHNNCSNGQPVGLVCNDPSAAVAKCLPGHWLCKNSDQCIPYDFMCDETADCKDSSDEDESLCKISYRLSANTTRGESIEGHVAVRHKGVWGTICSHRFGILEATVFCRSIGYNGVPTVLERNETVTQIEDDPVWFDYINCNGKELSLDKCAHNGIGKHKCDPKFNTYVKCSSSSSKIINYKPKDGNTNRPNSNDISGIPKLTLPTYCGIIQVKDHYDDVNASNEPVYRVVAGKKAKRGHHPWQASIRVNGFRGGSSHECGATVITAQHVITAAHCVSKYSPSYYSVRVGDHLTDIVDPNEREIRVKDLHIHEHFRKKHKSNNDIAIVELHDRIEFNEMVQPICLPSANALYRECEKCSISGWGSIQTSASGAAKELRSAQVPIISDEVCRQDNVYGNHLTENMFCAGDLLGKSVDACGGDSGGPLACEENDIHRLYGIISWGFRCGEENKPGVYVKLANYIQWINDKINTSKS